MSLRDDLIAAKALIDTPEKWIKGSYRDNGTRCAIGAVEDACEFNYFRDLSLRHDAIQACRWALRAAVPADFVFNPPSGSAALYNDDEATTHADVMALFDRAIEAAS